MTDWKTLAALGGLGAGALWLARREMHENYSGTGDDGMPWDTPVPVQRIYRFMLRSAKSKKKLGEGPGSIYWSQTGSKWSVGDNFDRLGHIIYDEDKDSYVYRSHYRNQRISKRQAEALAKSFFKDVADFLPVPLDEDEEDFGFA